MHDDIQIVPLKTEIINRDAGQRRQWELLNHRLSRTEICGRGRPEIDAKLIPAQNCASPRL